LKPHSTSDDAKTEMPKRTAKIQISTKFESAPAAHYTRRFGQRQSSDTIHSQSLRGDVTNTT
jgi:hypothetical protein